MILLRLITWPYVRKHLLRSVLTTAGIVLGVALLVGMQTANRSVLRAFNDTVDRIAGKSQLQVTAGDAGFGEDVLERVQSLREIRAAAPVIEAEADPGLAGQGKLLILAVDMTGDRSLRDYDFDNADQDVIDDPLIFLAQPDSLILTSEFAGRNHIAIGGKVAFDTMLGRKQFTVRGILKAGGMAQAFGGNLGIMDIYAAQSVFGRGRHFDRIDIGLQDGVTLEQGQALLSKLLGPGFTVEPPSGRGRQFESLLGVYTLAMTVSSMFALFIGMFIIYNSFAIAVTQRRGEIGILRALGATRGQIRTLFLGESAVAGLIGSAAGTVLGLLFARTLTGVYRQHVGIHVRRRSKRSGGCRRSRVPGLRRGDGHGNQHRRGPDSRAQRRPRRTNPGAPKGPLPGARRRREPHAPQPRPAGRGVRRRVPCAQLLPAPLSRASCSRWSPVCCSRRSLPSKWPDSCAGP